ncbi:MAG: phosphotransferase [Alphaproteobacteria bacterium]|nr:phosphotransferase [Alphaproteobacteria bacterium]
MVPEADLRDPTDRALVDGLRRTLAEHPACRELADCPLEPLRQKGLTHLHLRLAGAPRPLLARVPRLSRIQLDPQQNLDYQAACFERVTPSGHGPALWTVLAPSADLPMGALIVEEVVGHPPRLTDPETRDLHRIADALAAIHGMALPPPDRRPPLITQDNPVTGTLEIIRRQGAAFDHIDLPPPLRLFLTEELDWAERFAAKTKHADHPITLVGTDTHPGNFVITDADPARAVFVDLEKTLYGSPAIDLAHATLPTSTTFDLDCGAPLEPAQVADFYDTYFAARGSTVEQQLSPWLEPMRRLTRLRTLSFFARWKAGEAARPPATANDAELIRHVSARVDEAFSPDMIERFRMLEAALG